MIAAGSVVGVWAGYRDATHLEARVVGDLQAGQTELETSKALIKVAGQKSDPTKLTEAEQHIQLARAHFISARSRLEQSRLAALAAGTPGLTDYLKPRTNAIVNLSKMGVALADALQEGAEIDRSLFSPDPTAGPAALKLLNVLNASQPKLQAIEANLQTAAAAIKAIDPKVVPKSQLSALMSASQTIGKAVSGVDELRKLTPVLLEILGVNGPRTYLVEQVNPAELRAGGGFIGSYSILSVNQGAMSITKSGGIETVDYPRANRGQRGYVEPPKTSLEWYGDKSWVLGDSNFFPDFPSNAKAAEMLAQREIGIKPDGVISIDPDTVADLLQVTGPLSIPGYDVTVQGSTFSEYVFQRENIGSTSTPARKAFLGAVAGPLVVALSTLKADRWPSMVGAMNQAAAARHLQVYFDNPDAEARMTAYGWSGTLNPLKTMDLMAEIEDNFGASKANHFVQRSYDVQLSLVGNTLRHKVTVTIKNSTPPGLEGGNRYYRIYARLYVPADATKMTTLGLKADNYPNTDIPPGTEVGDGWTGVDVDRRLGFGTGSFTFEYETPWSIDALGDHTIYWQKQPGTGSDAITLTWLRDGHKLSTTGDLAVDRVIVLSPTQANIVPGLAATAQLPSLSF